jgi:hypothetical protein
MDNILKYFNNKIIEFILVLFGIYALLYILKIDLAIVITAILFVLYFYYKYNNREKEKDIILNRIEPEKFKNELPLTINKYDDVIDFLYYISDFKQYNEQVYHDFLINLNDFFTLYQDYQIIAPHRKQLMEDVLNDTKYKLLDGLSSFIYSFNNSPILREKLNNSINKLNDILNDYLLKLEININSVDAYNNNL